MNGIQSAAGQQLCINGSDEVVVCSAASSGLQTAYNAGNTITTTSGRNIAFTLGGSYATPTSFTLTNQGSAPAFIINDTNASSDTSLALQYNGTNNTTITAAGKISLAGNLAPDITTLVGGHSISIQPATSTTTANGGNLTLQAGNESGSAGTGGNLTIDAGSGNTTGGTINIGTGNANAINIGANNVLTTNNGITNSYPAFDRK